MRSRIKNRRAAWAAVCGLVVCAVNVLAVFLDGREHGLRWLTAAIFLLMTINSTRVATKPPPPRKPPPPPKPPKTDWYSPTVFDMWRERKARRAARGNLS